MVEANFQSLNRLFYWIDKLWANLQRETKCFELSGWSFAEGLLVKGISVELYELLPVARVLK